MMGGACKLQHVRPKRRYFLTRNNDTRTGSVKRVVLRRKRRASFARGLLAKSSLDQSHPITPLYERAPEVVDGSYWWMAYYIIYLVKLSHCTFISSLFVFLKLRKYRCFKYGIGYFWFLRLCFLFLQNIQ